MEKLSLLRCKHCGKIVERLPGVHGCPTMCCGDVMKEMIPNSEEASLEKHVPVVSINSNKIEISVGSTIHPMIDAHYISFIYLLTDKNVYRHDLSSKDEPKATFLLNENEKPLKVYAYCNLHGLWVKEL